MSTHSKTPYITPSMDFYSGKGVVRGRRAQGAAAGICLALPREFRIVHLAAHGEKKSLVQQLFARDFIDTAASEEDGSHVHTIEGAVRRQGAWSS